MADLAILQKRAAIIRAVRSFFEERGYLEVQTPVRLPSIAPEPFIEPITTEDQFLQTSPELCMKRLLSAGTERIFQICPCFRKRERGRLHIPEFTMLEWYRVGADYHSLMEECESLVYAVAGQCNPELLEDLGRPPWERFTVDKAFEMFSHCSLAEALSENRFEEILVEKIEPALADKGVVFLYDYPASMASLARLCEANSQVAERFELYIDGIEIANGFSELTDEKQQRQRFIQDRKVIADNGRDPGPLPEKFLTDLRAMPDSAGIALGLDRLVMVLTGCDSIDDVVTFTPENI